MVIADLVLINGDVITMNQANPKAQAVAVKKGRIIDVGTNSKIKEWIGQKTRIIDLKHSTLVPGFIDSHMHLMSLAHPFPWTDLRHVSSIREIQQRLKAKVQGTRKGEWILGRGWDQDRLKERRFPNRWDLDKVSVDNPVLITRVCGHAAVANSTALRIAGIDKKRAASLGELVQRDPKDGEPTGLLTEKAIDLVSNQLVPSETNLLNACSMACLEAAKVGLTSVTCISNEPNEIHALQKLRKQGKLPIRLNIAIPFECLGTFKNKQSVDPFLRLKCIKIFTDGSLGARTAALSAPYADEPSTSGILYHSLKQLEDLIKEADESGFQIAVHAIGDRAIEETLQAYATLGKERIAQNRHRIEHASVLNPSLIKRIKKLGLLVCVQPHFVVSDFWIPKRLGSERAQRVYAFRSLIEKDVRLAASSDAPVEPLNPLLGVWAAVTRESSVEERLSLEEALRAYTLDAAYFSFEEKLKGSIEMGKYADLAVLSDNPFRVKPQEIKDIRVLMTIVDGKVIYSAND